ncbi:MAG: TIGR00282 family metallophosphoesterase [Deltaproteobacteria bacterium]|nr:TIGR00282 family metallophosphoesterase [Deltaproteobacteria bacterium]
MKILFIGDVFGQPGRNAVKVIAPRLVANEGIALVVANVENAAGGAGVTPDTVDELLDAGVHVMTSGNHVWDKKQVIDVIGFEPRLLRPANYPPGNPGRGSVVAKTADGVKVGVINIEGNVFMRPKSCPFQTVREEIEAIRQETRVILVDLHAEATSEKKAMGWYLDGQVSLVIGTHTHVQTSDEKILPKGTAYLTDAGMTGPHDSVIGMRKEIVIERFVTSMPRRFEPATGDVRLQGAILEVDPETGRAISVRRVDEPLE